MTEPPLDGTALLALIVSAVVAFNQFRLIRANRRKVLAEGSDLSTQAADRMLNHWESDNERLRDRVERLERRCDALEGLLRENGIPLPSLD